MRCPSFLKTLIHSRRNQQRGPTTVEFSAQKLGTVLQNRRKDAAADAVAATKVLKSGSAFSLSTAGED